MRKAHYQITNFVGMWWNPVKRKWIPNYSPSLAGCSSHRSMQNAKEAWKHYREMGLGFLLLKTFSYKGKGYQQEWMYYPPQAQAICKKCKECRGRLPQDRVCMKCWRKILPFLKNRKETD
jgi:hypothetical protein